jgi:hypothetical protein
VPVNTLDVTYFLLVGGAEIIRHPNLPLGAIIDFGFRVRETPP